MFSTSLLFLKSTENEICTSFRIPKGCQPGHYLLGTINFFKDEVIKKVVS